MAETIHIGRKISRIREIRGIKQDHLAIELGISQQTISKIEQSETVEEETLGKIAKVLGVTPQAIKNFSEDAIINYFHDQSSFNFQCTFNPLDKVMELYERLLQAEREKNELLKSSK
ncbi:transcriptional regulator with XRE-family HTH domain [Pedobacter cryoconitis]|uniref:helix-turn-helix domain-containing protein n=1 Tax=Pedobacter cryoconitis TaxID=188932 RepID=UPI001616D9DC|nr:helix-turn-helix transcriptional regulator [Pedobacter cryoconitis]MBB6274375.1 transcriptional regulator with XRE-family HTH domain [Pedobacter cryoconitis]